MAGAARSTAGDTGQFYHRRRADSAAISVLVGTESEVGADEGAMPQYRHAAPRTGRCPGQRHPNRGG